MDAPTVRYARTSDGYSIAYAETGQGDPFVMTPHAFSHIQLYWQQESFLLPWLSGLAARFRLVQLDWRGQGMSSRGLRDDFQVQDMALDIEAVTDTLGLRQFVLFGVGGPADATIRYAAEHPARVTALVVVNFSPRAWPMSLFGRLPEENWDLFLETQVPFARQSEAWFQSLSRLRATIDQRDWLIRTRTPPPDLDPALARLKVPTLVLKPRDQSVPSEDDCRRLAARIAGASFVAIDGAGVLGDAAQGISTIERFLASVRSSPPPAMPATFSTARPRLTARETDVLRLIAAGHSNQQIADQLVLSLRTVERHITNLYSKIGAHSKAEATAYALRRVFTE